MSNNDQSAQQSNTPFNIPDAPPPPEEFDVRGFRKKYVHLEVFKGNGKQDLSYVPVSVNGYSWRIERGAKVIVPTAVVEALRNAVTDVTIQSEGGLITRPAPRFPFQVSGPATEAEYLAFCAKMRADTPAKASA